MSLPSKQEADILDEASLVPALEGAAYVIHVASPFKITADDPEKARRAAGRHVCHAQRAAAAAVRASVSCGVAACDSNGTTAAAVFAGDVDLHESRACKARQWSQAAPTRAPYLHGSVLLQDIVRPAVDGTKHVLQAAARHKATLKRVVVTSSVCGEGPTCACAPVGRVSTSAVVHTPVVMAPAAALYILPLQAGSAFAPQFPVTHRTPFFCTCAYACARPTLALPAVHDCHSRQARKGELYSEADWNEVSTLQDEPYWLSKVCAFACMHACARTYPASCTPPRSSSRCHARCVCRGWQDCHTQLHRWVFAAWEPGLTWHTYLHSPSALSGTPARR